MAIKLNGVQFGLKSYASLQKRTSAQREVDLKSQVLFHTKIARPEVQLSHSHWLRKRRDLEQKINKSHR